MCDSQPIELPLKYCLNVYLKWSKSQKITRQQFFLIKKTRKERKSAATKIKTKQKNKNET